MFSSHSEYCQRRGGHDYTEDSDRMPQDFVRCGYDADTQQYFFRDTATGKTWEGASGAYYGRMMCVSSATGDTSTIPERACEPNARGNGEEGTGQIDLVERCEEGSTMDKIWAVLGRLKASDDTHGGRRGYSAAILQRLSTTRPWELSHLLELTSTKFRWSNQESMSSAESREGKELRLSMIAAGKKRTLFDAM